jgi:Tol biopolymer transport system component
MKLFLRLLALCIVTVALVPGAAQAQNRPELKWHVLETPHLHVYYYNEVSQTASLVAETAEQVYQQLSERYGYDLKLPVRVVIDDSADPINGAAYHDYTLVMIEGQASTTEFRGVHDWLRDVVTHELAHLFSLQRAHMFGDLVPGLVLSGLEAPDVRPAQVAATMFLPNELSPRWFAEGIAQVDSTALGYDRWDSHRDMLLRTAFLEYGTFGLTGMGALADKNYLQAEKVYNQGFNFLSYLNTRFGESTARRIAEEAGRNFTWDFSNPLSKVLGGEPVTIFDEWKAEREAAYVSWLQYWMDYLYEGEFVTEQGSLTRRVAVSPDDRYLAFTANGTSDYPTGDLYLFDLNTEKTEVIFTGVGSQPAWLPDASAVIVSSDQAIDLTGFAYNDLYLVRIPGGKVSRLTTRMRAQDPDVSRDGRWVVATVGKDGARNLTLWPLENGKLGEPRRLTDFRAGIEAVNPRFSPDATQIVFSVNVGSSSDVWMLSVSDSTLRPVTQGPAEDIEPFFLDATNVVFVSDTRKAFDVYSMNLTDGTRKRWTTTVGGAFSPSASKAYLYYTVYHDEDFAIYRHALADGATDATEATQAIDGEAFAAAQTDMTTRFTPSFAARRYWFDALPLKVYPEFVYAERSARAGATLTWGDILGKHEFEVEVLLGENQDYHVGYQNHQFVPDLFLDVARYVRRNRSVSGVSVSKFDFTFDAAVAGAFFSYGNNFGITLTETFRLIDFGYPIDRELERGFEHAVDFIYIDMAPNISADINPTDGREFHFRIGSNQVRTLETTGSILDARYEWSDFWSWTAGYTEYLALPFGSTLEAGVQGGLLTRSVSPFDQLFLGGRIFFLRQGEFQTDTSFPGYEEFALSGEKLFLSSLAYRFPLWRGHANAGPFALDSVYLQVFGDAGNVLAHDVPWKELWKKAEARCAPGVRTCSLAEADLRGLYTDAGTELRVKTLLYDGYAWNSFFRVAYGFNEPDRSERFRWYLGLGIGY